MGRAREEAIMKSSQPQHREQLEMPMRPIGHHDFTYLEIMQNYRVSTKAKRLRHAQITRLRCLLSQLELSISSFPRVCAQRNQVFSVRTRAVFERFGSSQFRSGIIFPEDTPMRSLYKVAHNFIHVSLPFVRRLFRESA